MTSPRPAIEMIPIAQIKILNSRSRVRRTHRQITDNIEIVGLKRPVTVSRVRSSDGSVSYDLACGEGRLEAYQLLGQTEIPAIVTEADEETCLVMSLVENIARRQHRAVDLLEDVSGLRARGHGDKEIARKIGVSEAWVSMIATLLDKGESRLVNAAESGMIPLGVAVEISRSADVESQQALSEAYAQGKIKNRDVAPLRRLLSQRANSRKRHPESPFGRKPQYRAMTPERLMQIYQRQADRQRLLVKKADHAQTRLLFLIEALRDLRNNEAFIRLLEDEDLATMPSVLWARLSPAQIT